MQRIDASLESKESFELVIGTSELSTGTIGVELLYSERRLFFSVDTDPKKSSWAYVSKDGIRECGDLVPAPVEYLVSRLIEDHRQYQCEKRE